MIHEMLDDNGNQVKFDIPDFLSHCFVVNGVAYGATEGHQHYFKQVMANNKNVKNWVGVSEEEFHLSKKGFERDTN